MKSLDAEFSYDILYGSSIIVWYSSPTLHSLVGLKEFCRSYRTMSRRMTDSNLVEIRELDSLMVGVGYPGARGTQQS